MKKGLSQVDFAIAVGMFIIMFAFTLLFTTDRITLLKEETEGGEMRNYALTILNDLMSEGNELGLFSKEYRFTVVLNNSQEYLRNQSATLTDLNNELVQINLSQLGITNIDFNSIRVYNSSENAIKCEIDPSTKTIKFSTPIKLLEVKRFYVYFDDDSNFATPFCDTTITGDDNLTEIVEPIEAFEAVQFKKLETFSVYDPDHLVAYYTFDEPFDSTFIDYSNHENTGTFYGENFNDGTVYGANWTEGKFGKALSFDGVDDYVEIPDSPSVQNYTSFTVEVLFKYNGPGPIAKGFWTLIDKNPTGYGYNDPYHIYITNSSKEIFARVGNGSSEYYLDSNFQVDDGKFHSVSLVYNASSNTYLLYVDGQLRISKVAVSGWKPVQNSGPITIGVWPAYHDYFNGTIDEIRIYNHALSDEKIKSIYDNNTFIRDGLVAYWRFDEGDGQTVHDTHHIVYSSNKGGSKYGNAISFDGVDDYVEVSDDDSLDITNAITIEAWIKSDNITGYHAIISKALNPYELNIRSGHLRLELHLGDGTTYFRAETTSAWITPGVWHHVAGVRSGNTITLYVDGKSKPVTYIDPQSDLSMPKTTSPVLIGARRSGQLYFNGTIDEVYIYNRSLNETEVNQLYHNLAKYNQLKNQIPSRYNFHISIISNNETVFNFGPSVPQRGAEIYALDREILLQNNFGKLQPATMYLYLWK